MGLYSVTFAPHVGHEQAVQNKPRNTPNTNHDHTGSITQAVWRLRNIAYTFLHTWLYTQNVKLNMYTGHRLPNLFYLKYWITRNVIDSTCDQKFQKNYTYLNICSEDQIFIFDEYFCAFFDNSYNVVTRETSLTRCLHEVWWMNDVRSSAMTSSGMPFLSDVSACGR